MASPRVAFVAPLLAGCSLIYNPSNLPDPRMIDAAIVDSNACAVQVDGVSPATIDEGQGDGGSLPALVVLHGNNFVNTSLHVELKGPGGMTVPVAPVTDATASPDTTYLAFTVTVHADDGLNSAVPLDVVVTQDCNATATLQGQLVLQGLPSLTSPPASTSQLAKKYAKVALGNVTLSGSAAAVITSVSSIEIGDVTADAKGTTAGPGGASGGVTPGGGPGGGGQGASVSGLGLLGGGGGGGGGGYDSDGHAGTAGSGLGGGAGGGAGHQSGDDMLVSSTNNRASAGGGGGTGNLSGIAAGGAGGGGGGTVLVSAGGDIKIGDIHASGDAGEGKTNGGGGGGGGAGGTVLVSTGNGTLSVGTIHVAGGGGGGPNGGAGSPGRVRWDAPAGNAPASPDVAPHRGPALSAKARIVSSLPATLTAVGTRDRGFTVRVTDQGNVSHDAGHGVFDENGVATLTPPLSRGYNKVCVTLDDGSPGTIAERCIDVAFLP